MTSVILSPVSSNIYRDSNAEPQMMQIRSTNTASLYLDAQHCKLENDPTNIQISSISSIGERANQMGLGVRRIKIKHVGIYWTTPNINIRNNNIKFVSSNTLTTVHSVFITEGFYANASAIMDGIVLAMNSITGTTGLTFSKLVNPLNPFVYTLSCAGGLFHFDLSANSITHGYQMYNLPKTQVSATNMEIGTIGGKYTRYVDIRSTRLNQYTKKSPMSNSNSYNMIARIFVDRDYEAHYIVKDDYGELASYNYEDSDSLDFIDFQLIDQFGEPLYIGNGGDSPNGFTWEIELLLEL